MENMSWLFSNISNLSNQVPFKNCPQVKFYSVKNKLKYLFCNFSRLTMNNLGEPLTEAELTAMIAEADTDGDGKINFEEFKNLMANKAS